MSEPNSAQLEAFLARHALPAEVGVVVASHYQPLAEWLRSKKGADAELIGISGAQGTGKTTLADYLETALSQAAGWRVATLSLDDFYLTRPERRRLGVEVHPLLATRGAPGTHAVSLLRESIDRLRALRSGETLAVPRFDKAKDDRAPAETWPRIEGPIDLIVLEGWCVGARPQTAAELKRPINALEATRDPDGRWRTYVNARLADDYAQLFASLDKLVFLKAPDMDSVLRWRIEQEHKLAAARGKTGPGIMRDSEIAAFIQHYERVTRANIERLPAIADVVLDLDTAHQVVDSRYRAATGQT